MNGAEDVAVDEDAAPQDAWAATGAADDPVDETQETADGAELPNGDAWEAADWGDDQWAAWNCKTLLSSGWR